MPGFLLHITRNPISLAGAVFTTASAFLVLTLFGMEQVGFHGGPYLGILAFLILPAVFLFGLVLIPVGLLHEQRRQRSAVEAGAAPAAFPMWDLNQERTRRNFLIFIGATMVNVLILAVATYKGVEVMDSTSFCGASCHTVMEPEYTAYRRSAHARVNCVACHIGPGANWFVKSKLSGSWQLIAVTFNLYPRPIPVPVHNLRPARETCEQCHWPQKFIGDRLKVISHFTDEEKTSELKTVLRLKVGGIRPDRSHGIHWHVDPANVVRFRADAKRETVYEVEMTRAGETVRRWVGPAASQTESRQAVEWRTMDCVDCHNRPSHVFHSPEDEIDAALLDGRLDRALPFVRREGLKALRKDYPSHEASRKGIRSEMVAFYEGSWPQLARERAKSVEAAARELGTIYSSNVFPAMKVTWGTYPRHIGHMNGAGCLRCHDEEHKLNGGETISGDCSTCHSVLAEGEKNPAVLKPFVE